ncbi:MAG TPA: hypothetical protein V6D05_06905 [Stenomitos sp.]
MLNHGDLLAAIRSFRQGDYATARSGFEAILRAGSLHWQAVWRLVACERHLAIAAPLPRIAAELAPGSRPTFEHLVREAQDNLAKPEMELCSFKVNNCMNPSALRELAQRFDADVFVETGTFMGATTAIASEVFAEVHTIELSTELFAAARQRFAALPHVQVHLGDSSQVLHELLPSVAGRVVFWLDGHYSMGITAKGDKNTPVIEELTAIRQNPQIDPVILVDDLRCFLPEGAARTPSLEDYPSVADLQRAIAPLLAQPIFAVSGDVAIAYGGAHDVMPSPVLQACTLSRIFDGQGLVEPVIQAEELISEAGGGERDVLLGLPLVYGGDEVVGLGAHYRLWSGLVQAVTGDPAEACEDLSRAIELGLDHWRVHWYLAQAAHACGFSAQAAGALARVLAEAPDFTEASDLAAQLTVPAGAPGQER